MLERETLGYRERNSFVRITSVTLAHRDLVLPLSNQPVFTSQSSYAFGFQQIARDNLIPTTELMKKGRTLQIKLSSDPAWPRTSYVTLQSPQALVSSSQIRDPRVIVRTCCYARCPNPPAGKEKTSTTMQHAKEGKFIADSSQGPCCNQRSGAKSESSEPQFPGTFIGCSISNISSGQLAQADWSHVCGAISLVKHTLNFRARGTFQGTLLEAYWVLLIGQFLVACWSRRRITPPLGPLLAQGACHGTSLDSLTM